MQKIICSMMTLIAVVAAMAGTPDDTKKILPYPIEQHKLANGCNVVTVHYDSPGLAAFYIVMRVGSRDEVEEGKTGFAHFFEHMMFRGTDKYPKEKYSDVLKSIGASANANTSLDRTLYHMTGNAKKLDLMFELEADRFQNLKYSEQDFKTEAGAVKGEYTKNSASPYVQLDETINNTAFDKHTYKHTTMGFFKDVVDMPNQYQYSQLFFQRFYRPEYATIIVVGDVTSANVNALAEKYFGNWKRGDFKTQATPEPQQNGVRYSHITKPKFPPFISMNFKCPAFSDQTMDMPALDVLSSVLFSEKSDLYKKLVIDEQKVRNLSGGANDSRDPYLFGIDASLVKAEDMQYVKDQVMEALEKAKNIPVDEKTLAETKSNLKYSFAMRIDNPSAIAQAISTYVWLTGDPESLNRIYSLYDKITAKDLMEAAKKYFDQATLTIGTITPTDGPGVQ